LLLLASGLLFRSYTRRRSAKTKQKEAELQAQVADTETKALRAQMNPHFIFNSLNSIGNYLLQNDTKAADDYLSRFAQLMRLVLENSEHKEVPLSRDLKALELYMQLESFRLSNKFSYAIHVEESIDPEELQIPPSLLQPLVENSIWHGIMPKKTKGHIGISIKSENGMMSCIIEDDGVGIKNAEAQNAGKGHVSLGMKITRSRIEMLNLIKQANASIRWYPLENGTRVQVLLPQI
jgi:LytS/YehU family sensor histidine kinase